MAASGAAGLSSGTFGSNLGILGGRLGGSQFGLIAIGVDAGASRLLQRLSAEALITEKNFTSTGRAIGMFGATLHGSIATVATATAAVGGAALIVKQFNAVIAETSAITGTEFGQVFDTLGSKAIDLSTRLGVSASKIASAGKLLGQAGFSLQEIEQAIVPVTEFAVALGGDIPKAVDVAVKVLRGFNLEASETGRVLNTLMFAAVNSPSTLNDLQLAFKQLTPVAAQLGVTLESTAAAIAAVSRGGLSGETGGTSLATGLLKLVNPSKQVREEFGQLIGVFRDTIFATGDISLGFDAFLRAQGTNMFDFTGSIQQMRDALEGTEEEVLANVEAAAKLDKRFEVLNNIVKIFTVRSTKAWLNYSTQALRAREDTIAMELQLETTSEAAEKAIQNIGSQVGRIGNTLAAGLLGSKFGENLTSILSAIADDPALDAISEELAATFNQVLLELAGNMDEVLELINVLTEGLTTFTVATSAAVDILGVMVKFLNILPDSLIQVGVSALILNKLFGGGFRAVEERITSLRLIAAETAEAEVAMVTKEQEKAARAAGNLQKKEELELSRIINGLEKEQLGLLQAEVVASNKKAAAKHAEVRASLTASMNKKADLALEAKEMAFAIKNGALDEAEIQNLREQLTFVQGRILAEEHVIRIKQKGLQASAAELSMIKSQNAARLSAGVPAVVAGSAGKAAAGGAVVGAVGGAVAKTAVKGGIARGAGALLGGPVGITIAALSIAIPLFAAFRSASADADEAVSGFGQRLSNLGSNLDATTASLLGVTEAQEQFAQKSKLIGQTINEDDGISETFVIDIRGKTAEQYAEIQRLAEENGTVLTSINEQTLSSLSAQERANLEEFINSKNQEIDATNHVAKAKRNIIIESENKTLAFLQKIGIGILNGAISTFVAIGQIVTSSAFEIAAVWFDLGDIMSKVWDKVLHGIGEGFQFLINDVLIHQINQLIKAVNKIPGVNVPLVPEINLDFGLPSSVGDFFLKQADEARALAEEARSPAAREKVLEKLGLAKLLKQGAITQSEANEALDKYVLATKETTTKMERGAAALSTFLDGIGDIDKIAKRMTKVSIETVNGIERFTPVVAELTATGFKTAAALDQFADFFLKKEMLDITNEIINVFEAVGAKVPDAFSSLDAAAPGILQLLQGDLMAIGDNIAGMFADGFDANTFIEILAKAMDSPRFTQNNNIVVRISSSGNTQNNAELADQVVRKITNQGVPVGAGGA